MLDRLARLDVEFAGAPLTLRRAWPRGADHLLLEYVDEQGGLVPGQWRRDGARVERLAAATARRAAPGDVTVHAIAEGAVLLQRAGADRRLIGLAPLVARPDATLISHRPERRAVVRLGGGEPRFAKVVRPERLADLLRFVPLVATVAGAAFDVPRVLETDAARGVVTWSGLGGASLVDLLADEDRLADAFRLTGTALRHLHAAPGSCDTAHRADHEAALLRGRLDDLARLDPASHRLVAPLAPAVLAGLAEAPVPPVTIHRDFYDKQVIIGPSGRVGLLDFDTIAEGEPALDLANALVHLELRSLQERCRPEAVTIVGAALLEGYGADAVPPSRLDRYADATRLRLACLYAMRPAWRHLVPSIVQRLGRACPGRDARTARPQA